MRSIFLYLLLCVGLIACSPSRYITDGQPAPSDTAEAIRLAQQVLVNDTTLAGAHTGISIFDPAANRYLYNYQGDKYFVPASNTKLFTCYAAMKYLGDSLVGARYEERGNNVYVYGTADPTFLHPDYIYQPVFEYLKSKKGLHVDIIRNTDSTYGVNYMFSHYGKGWAWDDYVEEYMPERSFFPIHGNIVTFSIDRFDSLRVIPNYFKKTTWFIKDNSKFSVKREYSQNSFVVKGRSSSKETIINIPFVTSNFFYYNGSKHLTRTPDSLLSDMLGYSVGHSIGGIQFKDYYKPIHSQPTDSLLKPMMHRSDNFFAEQSLLMVSNEKLGYMNDEAIIDTLLKNDLKDLPQKPVWVDGSGLSRYNQFTPQDMVAVLLKMKNEFGLERIRNILPKGNTGTLTNYYQQLGPAIFAKTGSLSGQVALSGYLTCKSGKLLVFSILVNNHNSSGRAVRRAVEKFVTQVWEKN